MLIACGPLGFARGKQTGRRAFLMEVDALHGDVIVQRREQFTGLKAERIAARKEGADVAG